MAKVTFEFDDREEHDEVLTIANRFVLKGMLYDLAEYRRHLYKYENRGEIPVNEIIDKLDTILKDWYNLEEKIYF